MKTVSVTEANQQFSRLIQEIERSGEGYMIQRRGKVIARLVPEVEDRMDDPAWRAAYERMMARMQEGSDLGGLRVDRDDLYDR
ncbi:MAG: type II toxin-antitoxin system Phd/YefM family antitoxin [Alphaproteobacteria bacterium]|jgi:antitoxin (DNA-binding transcriptional repressor) of toxin-antitoxin stability system|nr:type II toxin-antitoxin system Phd/YefM family antitoxin [Alphaproteobacteria bacterium]HJP20829.1 type II toxin-antitoxin system Phd/YefM family antitoxin [Alphaproteobacteria bacterium]